MLHFLLAPTSWRRTSLAAGWQFCCRCPRCGSDTAPEVAAREEQLEEEARALVPQLQAASSTEDFPLAAVLQLLGKCQTAGLGGDHWLHFWLLSLCSVAASDRCRPLHVAAQGLARATTLAISPLSISQLRASCADACVEWAALEGLWARPGVTPPLATYLAFEAVSTSVIPDSVESNAIEFRHKPSFRTFQRWALGSPQLPRFCCDWATPMSLCSPCALRSLRALQPQVSLRYRSVMPAASREFRSSCFASLCCARIFQKMRQTIARSGSADRLAQASSSSSERSTQKLFEGEAWMACGQERCANKEAAPASLNMIRAGPMAPAVVEKRSTEQTCASSGDNLCPDPDSDKESSHLRGLQRVVLEVRQELDTRLRRVMTEEMLPLRLDLVQRQQQVQQMQLQEHLRAVWNSVLVLSVTSWAGPGPRKPDVLLGRVQPAKMCQTMGKANKTMEYHFLGEQGFGSLDILELQSLECRRTTETAESKTKSEQKCGLGSRCI
eukprot:s508_g12.t1